MFQCDILWFHHLYTAPHLSRYCTWADTLEQIFRHTLPHAHLTVQIVRKIFRNYFCFLNADAHNFGTNSSLNARNSTLNTELTVEIYLFYLLPCVPLWAEARCVGLKAGHECACLFKLQIMQLIKPGSQQRDDRRREKQKACYDPSSQPTVH